MEHYPQAAEFAVAFVPSGRWVGEDGYVVCPLIYGTKEVPTLLCALPQATIGALRALPRARRVEAMLRIEAERLRANYIASALPLPPAVARFFGDDGEETR